MLRPPLIFTTRFQRSMTNLHYHLTTLLTKRRTIARPLALFIIPTTAIIWWYYSVALSVAGMAPLRTANTSGESTLTEPLMISELPVDASVHNSIDTQTLIRDDAATTDVTVNGQPVPVPEEGVSRSVIEHADGHTKVDISVQSDTSGSNQSNSSTYFELNSSTSVTSESEYVVEEETR